MRLCIMAGLKLSEEPWIRGYLNNPNFIDYTDYFVRRRADNTLILDSDGQESDDESSDTNSSSCDLMSQVERDQIEYRNLKFLETHTNARRNNAWRHTLNGDDNERVDTEKNAKKIYALIKFHYTNPLSLQELARIQVRNAILKIDFKIKIKIENKLTLPKRLKEYLMLKEFNL
jgi:hypothetical protein